MAPTPHQLAAAAVMVVAVTLTTGVAATGRAAPADVVAAPAATPRLAASPPAPDLAGATRIVTDTHVIVLDAAGEWRRGLGRALDAARETGRRPGVLLLAADASELGVIERLRETVTHHGLEVDAWTLLPGAVQATPVALDAAPGPSGQEEREPARGATPRDAEPAAADAGPPSEEAAAEALRRLLPPPPGAAAAPPATPSPVDSAEPAAPRDRAAAADPADAADAADADLPGNRSLFDLAAPGSAPAPAAPTAPADAAAAAAAADPLAPPPRGGAARPAIEPPTTTTPAASPADRRPPAVDTARPRGTGFAEGVVELLTLLLVLLGLGLAVALLAVVIRWIASGIASWFRPDDQERVALGPLGRDAHAVDGAGAEADREAPHHTAGPASDADHRRPPFVAPAEPFASDPTVEADDPPGTPTWGEPSSPFVGVVPAGMAEPAEPAPAEATVAVMTPDPFAAPPPSPSPSTAPAVSAAPTDVGVVVVVPGGDGDDVPHAGDAPAPAAATAAGATVVGGQTVLRSPGAAFAGPTTVVGPGAHGGVVPVGPAGAAAPPTASPVAPGTATIDPHPSTRHLRLANGRILVVLRDEAPPAPDVADVRAAAEPADVSDVAGAPEPSDASDAPDAPDTFGAPDAPDPPDAPDARDATNPPPPSLPRNPEP